MLDGILDQYARFQLQKTRDLTRWGKLRRAQRGQVPPGRFVPFGYYYDKEVGTYRVDATTMPYVARIFREVGGEERSLTSVAKAFEREGVPTPGGGRHWYTSAIRDVVRNDIYISRTPEEMRLLAARGLLSGEVLSRLSDGPDDRHSVYWYNRSRVKRVYTGGKKLLVTPNEEEVWVAVPVEAAPVTRGWVEAAQSRIAGRVKNSWAGGQKKELSGGVARCSECEGNMMVFTAKRRSTRTFYYVCGSYGRHRGGECGARRYHRAESLEGQVRRFVWTLLHNPEVFREKIKEWEAEESEDLRRAESEARELQGIINEADEERDGYLRLAAKPGRLSETELDRYLAEIDERKATARGRLDVLLARLSGGSARRTESLTLMEECLRDLPYIIDRMPTLSEYETVPELRTEDNPLGIYTLTAERIRYRSEEELAHREQEAEAERAARFRWAYDLLGLKVKVHPDRRLEITWALDGSGQPRIIGPDDYPGPVDALPKPRLPARCTVEGRSW